MGVGGGERDLSLAVLETPIGKIVCFDECGKFLVNWVTVTEEQRQTLVTKVEAGANNTTEETLQDLFDFMQTCNPDN